MSNLYTYKDKTETLRYFSKKYNVKMEILYNRIGKLKWNIDKAIETNVLKINIMYTYKNITGTLGYFANKYNLNYSSLRYRIKKGLLIDEAIEFPANYKAKLYTYQGETQHLSYFADKHNICVRIVRKRINRGISIEKALKIRLPKNHNKHSYKGETESLEYFSDKYDVDLERLTCRVNDMKWDIRRAIEQPIKRKNILYEYNGALNTIRYYSEKYNINLGTLSMRIIKGMDIVTAIEKPLAPQNIQYKYKGEKGTLKYFSKKYNVSTTLIRGRLKSGWSIERCIEEPKEYQGEPNLIGQKFNRLEVIEPFDRCDRVRRWLCTCECGNLTLTTTYLLTSYTTVSCGCFNKETTSERVWTGHGDISGTYFVSLKHSAKSRNLDFDIDIEYIWKLFLKQKRKCALSGVELTFSRNLTKDRKLQNASLDRIDSNGGYLKENIQWVHKNINMMKMSMSDEEFISICNSVSNYQINRGQNG